MEEASGMDLRGFFAQWLHQGGIPHLEGSWSFSNDNKLTIDIGQKQDRYRYRIPVEFDVTFADEHIERISTELVDAEPASLSFDYDGEVVDVTIDPDTRLLASWVFERK